MTDAIKGRVIEAVGDQAIVKIVLVAMVTEEDEYKAFTETEDKWMENTTGSRN